MTRRKAFLIRADERLLEELRKWAADDLRSLNAQVEFLLRRAMKEWRGKEPGESDGGAGDDEPE